MISILPFGNACIDLIGTSSANVVAPITPPTFDIDNHAMAFAVFIPPGRIQVVSRGSLGLFNLTISSKSAVTALGTIANLIIPFQTVTGTATALTFTQGTPAVNFTQTDLPIGW